MDYRYLEQKTDTAGIATVTLNRAGKHNAFNEDFIAELTAALNAVGHDPAARVLVLRANGKNFCAGADIDWMRRSADHSHKENVRDAGALAEMLRVLNFLPVPTIARVQGAALGGGSGLVCCCDMVVAATDASFAFSEVRLGIIPATISPYAIRAVGARAARRWFLTGERFDAKQARDVGLVSEVVKAADLDATVQSLIDEILQCGPQAVRAAKKFLFQVAEAPISDDLIRLTSERIADLRASKEGQEGLAAFLEKRKAKWVAGK